MKMFLKMIACVMTFACVANASAAADRATPDEAVAMVQKTVAFFKKNGLDATIAEVNNPKGQFVDRDLYVTIVDANGINRAHGANPKMIGKDLSELRDADGNYISKQRNDVLKTKNDGWIKYRWVNPVTKAIEQKTLFFIKVDGYVISCGAYSI